MCGYQIDYTCPGNMGLYELYDCWTFLLFFSVHTCNGWGTCSTRHKWILIVLHYSSFSAGDIHCISFQNERSFLFWKVMSILRVPVRKTVNLSIQQFFRTSSLDGENQRFCAAFGDNQDVILELKLVTPQILIFQLQRFTQVGVGNFIKNTMTVSCNEWYIVGWENCRALHEA